MTVQTALENYYACRAHYDQVHNLSSIAHKNMKDAERLAVDAMLDEGTKSIGLDDGTHVSLRKQFNISVTVNNEDQIREWLTEVEGDDSEFIHEKVNKAAVVEWMKIQILEVGDLDEGDVPDFMSFSQHPGLTVRGWKTRETGETE